MHYSQRSEAATEFRIFSRKDAKAAKRKKYLSELSLAPLRLGSGHAWREEYPNPRCFVLGKFAQAAQFFKHSTHEGVTRGTMLFRSGAHWSPMCRSFSGSW